MGASDPADTEMTAVMAEGGVSDLSVAKTMGSGDLVASVSEQRRSLQLKLHIRVRATNLANISCSTTASNTSSACAQSARRSIVIIMADNNGCERK